MTFHRDENRSDTYQSDLTCTRYIIVNNIDFPVNEDRTSWLNSMNKPVITKIEFTKDEQDIIKKINEGQPVQSVRTKVSKDGVKTDVITHTRYTYMTSKKRLFSLYGGLCCICGKWPDYKVLYDVEGARKVERYCQNDLDKWMARID